MDEAEVRRTASSVVHMPQSSPWRRPRGRHLESGPQLPESVLAPARRQSCPPAPRGHLGTCPSSTWSSAASQTRAMSCLRTRKGNTPTLRAPAFCSHMAPSVSKACRCQAGTLLPIRAPYNTCLASAPETFACPSKHACARPFLQPAIELKRLN